MRHRLLTAQRQGQGGTRTEKEHELEIEVAPGPLIEQGQRAMRGEPNAYPELVEALVDNVRVLVRKAQSFTEAA